jgi:hypothetical protein
MLNFSDFCENFKEPQLVIVRFPRLSLEKKIADEVSKFSGCLLLTNRNLSFRVLAHSNQLAVRYHVDERSMARKVRLNPRHSNG